MSSKEKPRIQVLQGTLDLIVLRTLATMGPQHAYGIATRLQQVSEDLLNLNQGTLYPALVRLEQHGRPSGKTPDGGVLMRRFFARVRALLLHGRMEEELAREVASHLAL